MGMITSIRAPLPVADCTGTRDGGCRGTPGNVQAGARCVRSPAPTLADAVPLNGAAPVGDAQLADGAT